MAEPPAQLPVVEYMQRRYRCPHCPKTYVSRKRTEQHRDKCWYNRGCKSCRHASFGPYPMIDGCELGEQLEVAESPFATDFHEDVLIPRSQCPLWEAVVVEDGEQCPFCLRYTYHPGYGCVSCRRGLDSDEVNRSDDA